MSETTQEMMKPTEQQAGKTHRVRSMAIAIAASVLSLVIGITIGRSGARTITVTRTVHVAGPTKLVPGPTITKNVPAPPPPAGTQIGSWSGTGNQNTPAFNAPASGIYIVKWTFSGNTDPTIGSGSNFIISATDQNAMGDGLPNSIAASGSGSTEVTGASGVESFNVQATGSWTVTVTTAP